MTELFLVFIAACLANNLVLDYLLGTSAVFAVSRKIETAIGLSIAMLVILPVTSMFTYAINLCILTPFDLEFLRLLFFVILDSLIVLLIEKILKKYWPILHEKTAVFIPILLVNTSLVGAVLINIQQNQGLITSLFFGIGSASGFGLVVVIFTALRDRIIVSDIPVAFQGASIMLITLGILSMAFMGFTGLA